MSKKILAVALGAFMLAGNTGMAFAEIQATVKKGVSKTRVLEVQEALNICSDAGLVEDGLWGAKTTAAVKAFQADNGISTVGFVGPATAAALNDCLSDDGSSEPSTEAPASSTPGCAPGASFSATTGQPCVVATPSTPGCPAGALFSSVTGQPCATTTPTTPAGLTGGAGDLEDVDVLSTYNNEDILEGADNAKVMAFELEADNGSDLAINSIKLAFAHNSTDDGSDRMNKYMQGVKVWMGSTEVGAASVSEFSETSDVYSKSIALSGVVVKADQKVTLVVSVDANDGIDSGDMNEDWTVELQNVRFQDATGVVTTATDIGDMNTVNTITNTTQEGPEALFEFEDLTSSGDLEAKISKGSNSPTAQVVAVNETSDTNSVLLLEAKLKAEGSDLVVDQLTFDVTPTGANANEIVKEYHLFVDGDEVDSISATSIATTVTGQIVFTDLEDDFKVDQGDTATIQLKADVNDLEGNFGNGDSILVSLTSTNFNSTNSIVEDENGDTVPNTDRSGSVAGDTQTFYADGIRVTLVSTTATTEAVGTSGDINGDFSLTFKVEAFGDDVLIRNNTTNATILSATATPTTAGQGTIVAVGGNVTALTDLNTTVASYGIFESTSSETEDVAGSYFWIDEGSSRTFTVKYENILPTAAGNKNVEFLIRSINWALNTKAISTTLEAGVNDGLSAVNAADFTGYYTSDLNNFKTGQKNVVNI